MLAALVAAATMLLPAAALAQSCASLQSELASLGSSRGSGGGQWSDAAQRQRAAIRQTESEMRAAGCGGFFATGVCGTLNGRLAEMRANLARLESGASRRGETSGRRAQILAQMASLGCNRGAPAPALPTTARAPVPPQPVAPQPMREAAMPGERLFIANGPSGVAYLYREDASGRISMVRPVSNSPVREARAVQSAPRAPQGSGFFGGWFGAPPGVETELLDTPAEPTERSVGGGTGLRTLCVRTCDGYYFPVSNSTGDHRFSADASICAAQCPGTETRLYYYRNASEDADAMVSADDRREPYTKLPNAFRYREGLVAGCQCGRPLPGMTPLPGTTSGDPNAPQDDPNLRPTIPVPGVRVAADEDPETQANQATGFTPIPAFAPPPAVQTTPGQPMATGPGGRKVRIVGPNYYIAQ
jgi:hypothetical protein